MKAKRVNLSMYKSDALDTQDGIEDCEGFSFSKMCTLVNDSVVQLYITHYEDSKKEMYEIMVFSKYPSAIIEGHTVQEITAIDPPKDHFCSQYYRSDMKEENTTAFGDAMEDYKDVISSLMTY